MKAVKVIAVLVGIIFFLHYTTHAGWKMSDYTGFAAVCGIVAFAATIYFLPYAIGNARGVIAAPLLGLVNTLFGWTLIGWLACLLWAVLGTTAAQHAFYLKALRDQKH